MYEQLLSVIGAEFPGFRVVRKSDSRFMKVLSFLLVVVTFGQMRSFMDGFTTTIGSTVYTPSLWEKMPDEEKCSILLHERVHLRQQKRYGRLLFGFLYLVVFFPLGLAYFRARFEKEAYTETMRSIKERHGAGVLYSKSLRQSIVRHFTSAEYGWMWPFKGAVERWYDDTVEKLNA